MTNNQLPEKKPAPRRLHSDLIIEIVIVRRKLSLQILMHAAGAYAQPLNCSISKTVHRRTPVLDLIKRIRPFVIDFVSN